MPWRAHIYLRHVLYSTVQHSTDCRTQPTWASLHLVCNYGNLISRLLEIATCVTDTDVTEFRTRLMACHLGLAARDLVETSAVIRSMPMLQLASEAGLASAFRAPLTISSVGPPSSLPRPLPNSRSGSYSLVASAPSVPISANAVTPRLPGPCHALGKPWSVKARHTVIVLSPHRDLGWVRSHPPTLPPACQVVSRIPGPSGRSPHRGDDPGLVVTFGDLLSR
ncbi:hypothetical protein EDB80DRAFT_293418 [Ilyonectria destructans]|nr:hypothetical protein EDB80DRAFT_293418 [Ilyonectria destructans]